MTPTDGKDSYEMIYMPHYTFKAIEIPPLMQESSDSMAQMVVEFLHLFNDTEKYVELFAFPDYDSIEYTSEQPWIKKFYSEGGAEITVTLTAEKYTYGIETDYYSEWEIQISGTGTLTGDVYNNWRSASATMWNGENTYLKIYDENSENILYTVLWFCESLNENSYHLGFYKDNVINDWVVIETGAKNKFEKRIDEHHVGYPDYSWLEYSIEWFSDGHGEWVKYATEGGIAAEGSW